MARVKTLTALLVIDPYNDFISEGGHGAGPPRGGLTRLLVTGAAGDVGAIGRNLTALPTGGFFSADQREPW